MGPNLPNNKHNSEEHLWHVGSTTSTVGPSRVARLGWLPSQANLMCMMAGVEIDRCATVHEMSNQQSEKQSWQSFPNKMQNWIALGKLVATYLAALLVCTAESLPRYLCQSCDSYAAAFAVEMWAQTGQKANTAWKNTCGTLAVQLQQWHPPCEWRG